MSNRAGRALLGGGLVCLAGFLALTVVVTQEGFQTADRLARTLVQQSSHPLLQPFMESVSTLGGHPGQLALVVLGSVLLWPRRRRWALSLPIVMAGAGTLQLLAKWAVARPRPNLDPWGFPSAHVLTLVVLLGYLAYLVGVSSAGRGWRGLGVGACAAAVCTVAYSRMYLQAHWFSDVLGGMSSGLAYLLVAVWLIRSIPVARGAPALPAVAAAGGPDGVAAVAAASPVPATAAS